MIINQEDLFVFDSFSSKQALEIGNIISKMAIDREIKLGIDIFFNGKQIYHFLTDYTIPDNDQWLIRKRNTVLYFNNSTKYMNNKLQNDASLLSTKYGLKLSNYAIVAGGYPLYIKNVGFCGAICITGQQPDVDHCFVETVLSKCKYCHK